MAGFTFCPQCGSARIVYDGLSYQWLCLNEGCLHTWTDEDVTFVSFPAPPLNTGDRDTPPGSGAADDASGPTA
jgi:hypothetical protein